MASIGVKVKLEGAQEYKQQMSQMTSQTKLFQAQMKNLQSQTGKSAFTKSIQESKILSQELTTLREKSSLLSQKIEEASAKYGENSTQVNRLKTQYENLQAEINTVNQALMSHGGYLGAVGAEMQAVGEKMKTIGQSISGLGDKLTASVTLPLVAIGTKGVMAFAEVDKTMQLVNSTMGNTAAETEALSKAMKQAAANSTFGMSDAATVTLNFARAGLKAKEAAAALAPAMNLAAGEGGDLDTVSAGLVATINGFAGSFDEAATYADVFAAACNNSALDVNSLSESMSVAAPIFAAAGYKVKDAALYMGVMANAGIDANTAANALKTGFARLVSPAKEGAKMLDQLNISITNADGTMKDTLTIQRELHDAFAELSESEQIAAASAIFGKNQMSNWLALINTAPDEVGELNSALTESAGLTQSMADAMMSGFGGSLEKLKSSIDVAVTSLGEALAPTISQVADEIQRLVDLFNSLTPAQQEQIAQILMLVAALGPVLAIGGRIITGLGAITEAVGTLLTNLPALGAAIGAISLPVAAIIAGIAALVAGFVALYNTNEEFRVKVQTTWTQIQEILSTICANIMELVGAVVAQLQAFWEEHGETITTIMTTVFDILSTLLTGLLEHISLVIDTLTALVNGDWTTVWNNMGLIVQNAWDTIKTVLSSMLTIIKALIIAKLNEIKQNVEERFNLIKTLVTSLKDSITTIIKNLVNDALSWGRDFVQNFIDGITEKMGALLDKVRGMADNIRSYLHFSEPDKGPLKDFNSWPRDMMEQYAQGIENGRYLVQKAVSDVSADVALMERDSLSADEIYSAVNAGASDANISIVIGDRELGRALREMGVVMA